VRLCVAQYSFYLVPLPITLASTSLR